MAINKQLKKLYGENKRIVGIGIIAIAILLGSIPLTNYMKGSHAASSTLLYLSPATQTSTVGDTIVVSIILNPSTASVNTVQSVLSYSAVNYSVVSVAAGASFPTFINTPTSGKITFTGATNSTSPVTTTSTVVTVTLRAIGAGNSALSLSAVCPSGDFSPTCSAAYDSVTSNNDLGNVAGSNFIVNPIIPTTPTLSITGSTTSSISLSWTASTDSNGTTNGPGIAGYKIFRNGSTTALTTTSSTTYTDSGLSPNTNYSYTVLAYDNGPTVQTSPLSTNVNLTTASPIPTTPTGLTKSAATFDSVTLTWTASTDNGGTLAGYKVYVGTSTNPVCTSASTTCIATNLTANTLYNLTVKAYDTSATTNYSNGATLSASTYKIGDLDGDGLITGHDLSIIITNYNTNYPAAEFDGTNVVEGHDLSLLLGNYGK